MEYTKEQKKKIAKHAAEIKEISTVDGPNCIGCEHKSKKERILKGYTNHIY